MTAVINTFLEPDQRSSTTKVSMFNKLSKNKIIKCLFLQKNYERNRLYPSKSPKMG